MVDHAEGAFVETMEGLTKKKANSNSSGLVKNKSVTNKSEYKVIISKNHIN